MTYTTNGTNGNDTINGTNGNDTIFAKAGNDVINAGNGNDDVDAGSGNDTVNAGNGNDEVEGGSGNDIINGEAGNDELHGGDGNDTIDGGTGDDLLDGGDGDDVLKGNAGCDVILGGDGNDTINAGGGNDLIYGGQGTDTAIFAGSYASYDIFNLFGLVFINGQDGTDLALDVEFLKFDNGTYNVATHTFTPNQPTTMVSVVATDGVGTETVDGNDFTYTFTRTGDLSQALTVNYSIAPAAVNGATPGADFPAQTGTITFAAGSNTAVLQFSATDDAIIEGTEAFSVALGAGSGYQVNAASASANGTITDNDFPPAVVSLTPATVTTIEGGNLTFTFTRAGGNLAAPLTINYIVNDGPPLGGATRADGDFTYASGIQQLTFAAGQTVATITVQSNQDAKFEGNESFPVLLAGGVNYTVDPANNGSTGVIQNDDPAPLVSVTATDGVGTETVDGTDFTFTFSRTGNTSQALTVNYSIFPAPVDGATPGVDFPAQTGTITFAAGSATALLQFGAIDDAIIENTEFFSVVVGVGAGYQVDIPNATANASIIDNDFTPAIVSLTPATVTTTEGGALAFTFTRSGGNLAAALTINYVVNDGGPAGGATRADGDFSYPTGMQQLTFAAGETVATITVQTNQDTKFEGTESFPVLLAGGLDYTVDPVNNGSTGVIQDDDPAPLVSVTATDGVGTETIDGTDFTFTFGRTGDTSQPLTVNYSIFPAPVDGAVPGVDFPAQTGTITFAAGSSTAVLSFDAIHDAVVENTEFFSVVVGVGAGYQVDIPNATANASITDGTIVGTNGPDSLVGTADPDAILGLEGDDAIDGQAGNDALFGGNGNDGLAGGMGDDFLDGGAGFDRAIYTTATLAVNIQLAAGTATLGTSVDTLRFVEFARGTAQNDTFNAAGFGTGSTNASSEGGNFNAFEGLAGDDQIFGNGNTRIEYTASTAGVTVTFNSLTPGGGGGGTASGAGVGTDTFSGVRDVRGSQGNDLIINFGATSNTFDGQGGFDTVSYASLATGITANLQSGNVFVPTPGGSPWNDALIVGGIVTIEGIIGTSFNDTFFGNGVANSFDGLAGVDIAVFGSTRGSSSWTDNGAGSVSVTTPGGGSDALTNVELMQFTDAFQLTSAGQNADLSGITGFPAPALFGTGLNETITIGPSLNGHTIDLDGGTDTILLGLPGLQSYNLGLGNVEFLTGRDDAGENVFLFTPANGLTVNLGIGTDQLMLGSNGNNTVTVISVETIGGGTGDDAVTFVLNDITVNQEINLNNGNDMLNLEGTSSSYSLTLQGVERVNGHAAAVNDNLNVRNLQLGTTFDLGAGNADELHLNTAPTFPGGPNGINVVTVYNTEKVFGALADGDQIHIGGNVGGVTTVTAGLGSDLVWASIDADQFRFITTGDSSFDIPFGGQRDIITGFDALEDAFVFDHIVGATSVYWEEINFGGTDIVIVDLDGVHSTDINGNHFGFEMAIQLDNHIGTLSNSNFILIT